MSYIRTVRTRNYNTVLNNLISQFHALALVHIAQESRERVASEAQLVQKRAHRVAIQRGRQRAVERNVGRKRAPLPRPTGGADRRYVAD